MNIHLRTTYRGRMRDMKRILVVKAMVLGAIACSISAIGFAAGVGVYTYTRCNQYATK